MTFYLLILNCYDNFCYECLSSLLYKVMYVAKRFARLQITKQMLSFTDTTYFILSTGNVFIMG